MENSKEINNLRLEKKKILDEYSTSIKLLVEKHD